MASVWVNFRDRERMRICASPQACPIHSPQSHLPESLSPDNTMTTLDTSTPTLHSHPSFFLSLYSLLYKNLSVFRSSSSYILLGLILPLLSSVSLSLLSLSLYETEKIIEAPLVYDLSTVWNVDVFKMKIQLEIGWILPLEDSMGGGHRVEDSYASSHSDIMPERASWWDNDMTQQHQSFTTGNVHAELYESSSSPRHRPNNTANTAPIAPREKILKLFEYMKQYSEQEVHLSMVEFQSIREMREYAKRNSTQLIGAYVFENVPTEPADLWDVRIIYYGIKQHMRLPVLAQILMHSLQDLNEERKLHEPSTGRYHVYYQEYPKSDVSSIIFVQIAPYFLTIGLTSLIPLFTQLIAVELEKELKLHLRLFGVKRSLYWFSKLLSDWTLYMCTVIFQWLCVGVVSRSPAFVQNHPLASILLYTTYGFTIISFSYLLSFLFPKEKDASKWCGLFVSLSVSLTYLIVTLFLNNDIPDWLQYTLSFLPTYSLYFGLTVLGEAVVDDEPVSLLDMMSFSGYGRHISITLLIMFLEACLFSISIVLLEWTQHKWRSPESWFNVRSKFISQWEEDNQNQEIDESVQRENWLVEEVLRNSLKKRKKSIKLQEMESVANHPPSTMSGTPSVSNSPPRDDAQIFDSISPSTPSAQLAQTPPRTTPSSSVYGATPSRSRRTLKDYPLCVSHLHKIYKSRKSKAPNHAVKNVTFLVERGEIFSLIGKNAAGKTSILDMITGKRPYNKGSIYINGHNLYKSSNKAYRSMGVVPQNNRLWENLTCYQHVKIFSLLRGISDKKEFRRVLEQHALTEHANKKVKHLSGGNKRKLSVALAFLGNPKVLFLDEPSSSMDPASRRQLWSQLQRLKEGRVIVMTSHSMEEVEQVSDRVAILVNGELQCVDHLQELKNRYEAGYQIAITMAHAKLVPRAHRVIEQFFTDAQGSKHIHLVNKINDSLRYEVNASYRPLSTLFEQFEQWKEELKIVDYTISQATLEQLFSLDFTSLREFGQFRHEG